MKFILHILLHAESVEDVPTAALTLKTVRIGYPNAHMINVYITRRSDNGIFDAHVDQNEWPWMPLDEPDSVVRQRQEHPFFINRMIFAEHMDDDTNENVHVILDGDLIFLGNVQELIEKQITENPTQLMIGQYIASHTSCGMTWMERLHTSMLVFPNVKRLVEVFAGNPWNTPWTPFTPVAPALMFIYGKPYFFDTAANLFHLLLRWDKEYLGQFAPNIHGRYIHLLCGSSKSILATRLNPEHYSDLTKRHLLALSDPVRLLYTNTAFTEYMFDSNRPKFVADPIIWDTTVQSGE